MVAVYEVDPDQSFRRAIKKSLRLLSDLTVPYTLMTKSWYKSNRSIFDMGRQGPGKYADLSPRYKPAKQRAVGFVYPILVRKGKLARSMTVPDDPGSVATIINKKILILGTKVSSKGFSYPQALHFGTSKMPARPFVLLGGEQVSPQNINRRRVAWIKLLGDYALQVSKFAEKK